MPPESIDFNMHLENRWQIIFVLLFVPLSALAQGGPPMITDDPDTPGPGCWEINLPGVLVFSPCPRHENH